MHITFSDFVDKIKFESMYTLIGIDLIDNNNQRGKIWDAKLNKYVDDYRYPVDNVSGYTIAQIENAIKGAKTLEQWRDNLKNQFDNPIENKLDELFNNYIN